MYMYSQVYMYLFNATCENWRNQRNPAKVLPLSIDLHVLSPLLLFFLFLGTTTTHNFVVFPSCFLTLARTKIHRSTPTAFLQRCSFLAFGGPTIGACTFHLNQISPIGHVEHAALLHQFFLVLFSLSFHVGSKNFEVFFGPTVSVGNAKL